MPLCNFCLTHNTTQTTQHHTPIIQQTFLPTPLPSAHTDNDPKLGSGRIAELTLTQEGVSAVEHTGTTMGDMRQRTVLQIKWTDLSEIAWDHQQSQVRFTKPSPSASSPTGAAGQPPPPRPAPSCCIFLVGNSIELEGNIKLRLAGLRKKLGNTIRTPTSLYVGMFAGVTKPKPFQRKRASLTTDPSEALPPLDKMRQWAIDSYQGSGRPLATERR